MFPYRLLYFILISSLFIGCNNDQSGKKEQNTLNAKKDTTAKAPIMNFGGKNLVDLGKIVEGEKISHTFEFTNTGNAPLQISYANASCGCTVPTWPKEPIPAGGKGSILVEFNSKNKEGKLLKKVSIYSNTKPEFNTIAFNIEVVKKE
jgi:Protein of unknown function (DUF1573)